MSRKDLRPLTCLTLTLALAAVTLAAAQEAPRERHESLVVEDAYRTTLAAWAADLSLESVTALADLEVRFADEKPSLCLDWAEQHTFESLVRADPGSVLTVLAFHVEVWLDHVNGKRFALGLETRERLGPWLDLYVGEGGAGAGTWAGRLLVHWVELMFASRYSAGAGELLARSLRYDPELPEALLLSARAAERTWKPDEALTHLERLLRLRPDDVHARLRRGVNLTRVGRVGAGVRELEVVARGNGAAWMRIVAYQELARFETAVGRVDAAIALVQEALGHFPRSEQLALQLAHLRRRRDGRPSPLAGEVLNAWTADTGATPRLRYEHEPRRIADLRRRLAAEIDHRRPRLAHTLGEIALDDGARPRSPACRKKARLLE